MKTLFKEKFRFFTNQYSLDISSDWLFDKEGRLNEKSVKWKTCFQNSGIYWLFWSLWIYLMSGPSKALRVYRIAKAFE